jgi:hypothetical protein
VCDRLDVLPAIVPGCGKPERELVIPDVMPAMGMRDLVVGFGCACWSKVISLFDTVDCIGGTYYMVVLHVGQLRMEFSP